MPAAAKRRRVKHYRIGDPHRKIRRSCKHCRRSGHNHVPGTGNAHRFHGPGSFCSTHATTVRGKKYCKISKGKPKRSNFVIGRTGIWHQPHGKRYLRSSKG
jgi:hypothetical protein